jgi:D-alanine--poly(phosphoribitol) ligase subunit 2
MSERVRRIEKLFTHRLMIAAPQPDQDLVESGILDSMAMVELLFGLEEEFGFRVNIAELDVENFRCIANIAAMIEGAETRKVA